VKAPARRSVAELKVSVIIPTLNGGKAFLECLDGIRRQEGVGSVELVELDSGSEDGTRDAAAEVGARVVSIDMEQFNHGAVRDIGARSASGDVLVFTVQDARPADAAWLRFLVEPLAGGAAAASSRILPRPEAGPLARRTALDSPMASDKPWTANPEDAKLEPEALRRFVRFDDISSGIRADVYRKIPFKAKAMSEDMQWAIDALDQGLSLVFEPRSVVYHCHEYTPLGAYRRYMLDARAAWEILGLRTRRGLAHSLRGYFYELFRDFSFLMKRNPWDLVRYGPYAVALRMFQVVGQMRGSP